MTFDMIWEEFTARLEGIVQGCTSGFMNAGDAAIGKFESKIGIPLPADFKRYLQIAGGRKEDRPSLPSFGDFSLLSLAEIEADRERLLFIFGDEPPVEHILENRMKPCIWSPLWIPFIEFNATNRLILDLDPGKNGHLGQIVLDYPGIARESDKVQVSGSFTNFIQETSHRLHESTCKLKDGRIDLGNWPYHTARKENQ